jgi:hypothetical protein
VLKFHEQILIARAKKIEIFCLIPNKMMLELVKLLLWYSITSLHPKYSVEAIFIAMGGDALKTQRLG